MLPRAGRIDNCAVSHYTRRMRADIAQATEQDISAIRSVQRSTWLETYPNKSLGITRADIAKKFAHDDSPAGRPMWLAERVAQLENARFNAWVARAEGKIVGYCIAEKEQTQNRIKALYILPAFQKQGIGTALLDTAFAWMGEDKKIYINVASYNARAIMFYQTRGFVKTNASVSDEVAVLPSSKQIPEIEMVKGA